MTPISSPAMQTTATTSVPKSLSLVRSAPAKPSTCVPRHMAIVLDTGKYSDAAAPAQILEAMRDLVCSCVEQGVECLSVLVSEQTVRNSAMIDALELFIRTQAAALAHSGVRVTALTPPNLSGTEKLISAIRETAGHASDEIRLNFTIAVNYDGRAELIAAVKKLADDAAAGRIAPEKISAETIERSLFVRGMPPVDLLVRMGGNKNVSSFLLWQAAYAELYFLDIPFTQFRRQHLKAALNDYARRSRTFGALPL